MKKTCAIILALLFFVPGALLFAQEAEVVEQPAVTEEKPAEPAVKEEKKKATKAFEVGEIVVQDKALASMEQASTTTEITDQDIKARSEKTLDQTLEMVPGIKVETSNKGTKRFLMRGYDQDKIAILVDGILQNDVYEANVDVAQIPVLNASRIIVNRGASSALYGTNGAIGSINVITKKPELMYTDVNAEYGEYNNYTLNVAHGAPMGDLYYWITASMMNSDGYEVSKKLDKDKRREWFDKLVRYDLYGVTFGGITLEAVDNYINDTGKWNHTEYTKYQVGGKVGYAVNEDIEVGVSASYALNEQKANTFSHNCFSSYGWDAGNSWYEWSDPNPAAFTAAREGRRAVFQNRAFYWPERSDLSVSPYVTADMGDLSVKANVFYYQQVTDLEGYATQDHDVYFFPPSISTVSSNPYTSIWTEKSMGINLYPSYKLLPWNKLNAAVLYRKDSHTEEEQALSSSLSPDIYAIHGNDVYNTRSVEADFVTLAIEDEISLLKKSLLITVGISYDAQNFIDNKKLDTVVSDYDMQEQYMVEDDAMVWGTRDSFNPVLGVVHTTIPGLLKLRAAFSSKTKFPPLSAYARVTDAASDLELKPERSYNGNAGAEFMLLDGMIILGVDYFYTRFDDKIERFYIEDVGLTTYTNIDGAVSQGAEAVLSSKVEKIAGLFDLAGSLSYTYVHARRRDDTKDVSINKGDMFEGTPEHVFIADVRLDFVSATSLNIFGSYTMNQIMYAMKERPAPTGVAAEYSTKYFKAVELHNPLMLNVKVSQRLLSYFEVYVLCRNILDDYNADPFNPGPGRMFYLGGSGTL